MAIRKIRKPAAVWTKDSIQKLLETNDRAVERALVQIYWRQTDAEQQAHSTTEANGRGFTAFDADFLSDVAQKCIRYNGLTAGQMRVVRPKMMKYWKQLLEIASNHPTAAVTDAAATDDTNQGLS